MWLLIEKENLKHETWKYNLHKSSQLLTGWGNLLVKIARGIESAHTKAPYLKGLQNKTVLFSKEM